MGKRARLLRATCLVLTFVTLRAAPASGQDPAPDGSPVPGEAPRLRFSLRPEIGYQGGTEVYELTAAISTLSVRSTLTYPVGALLVGGRATASYGMVELTGMLHVSATDPAGKMLDQDFINSIELSHTESRTEAKMLVAELSAHVRLRERPPAHGDPAFSLVGGFRHATNAFDVYGASGWQAADGGTQVAVSLPDDLHGVHYESRYEIPFVGARVDALAGELVSLSLEARILSAWSHHVDDHVFRHKTGTADMQSFGGLLAGEAAWAVAAPLYLGAHAEAQILHGSGGTLKQRFYADDPSSSKVEGPDTPIIDAKFAFQSDRWKLFAFVGLSF